MTPAPPVAVVMPVRNGTAHLREAVESILSQDFGDFEFVVVDDGSTDGSGDLVRAYDDPRINVIALDGRGIVAALQAALESTSAPFIARMDADDVSLPHRLTAQVALMRDCGDATAVVGSSYEVIDDQGQSLFIEPVPTRASDLRRALLLRNPFGHGTVLIRRAWLDAVGGYASTAPVEDLDLWVRMFQAADCVAVPDVLYRWRLHQSGVSSSQAETQSRLTLERLDGVRRDDDAWQSVAAPVREGIRYYRTLATPLRDKLARRFVRDYVNVATLARRLNRRRLGLEMGLHLAAAGVTYSPHLLREALARPTISRQASRVSAP